MNSYDPRDDRPRRPAGPKGAPRPPGPGGSRPNQGRPYGPRPQGPESPGYRPAGPGGPRRPGGPRPGGPRPGGPGPGGRRPGGPGGRDEQRPAVDRWVAPPKPAEPSITSTPVAAPAPIRPGPSPTGVYELIATTAFGLEAIVDRELKALGYTETRIEDGRVGFWGNFQAVCRANLWLRSADRVQIVLGEFEADDFDPLFFQTREIPWEEWLPMDAQFPVNGRSFQSRLHGVPVCQKMIKKAIVERLKTKYQRAWFQETGPLYEIDFIILRDRVTLTLDASGDGLHKRGYRPEAGIAPLRETLAAALIQLSYWNRDRLLVDPCCGTGTIPIEAAMIARNIAPGFNREFSSEGWPQIPSKFWAEARKEARDLRGKPLSMRIWGSDIDPRAIELARKNAKDAGVAEDIMFSVKPAGQLALTQEYACLVTNPPYGERMGDRDLVDALNRDLGAIARSHPTWSTYVLTPHPLLERQFGRPADRRRKLFNGRIECTYYQFYGPRPPLEGSPEEPAHSETAAPLRNQPVAEPAPNEPSAEPVSHSPEAGSQEEVGKPTTEAEAGVEGAGPASERVETAENDADEADRPRSLWDMARDETEET